MAGIVRTFLFKLVLENAIEMEEKAYNFYENAISKVEDPEPKQILRDLASQELKHRLKLEEVQREVSLGRFQVTENESAETIDTIAADWPEIGSEATSQEILEIALSKEQYAYSFYTILRDKSTIKTVKEIFDALALEEKKHVDWVSAEIGKEEG